MRHDAKNRRYTFLKALRDHVGDRNTDGRLAARRVFTRKELVEVMEKNDFESAYFPTWLTADKTHRVDRGVYRIPAEEFGDLDDFLSGAESVDPDPVAPPEFSKAKVRKYTFLKELRDASPSLDTFTRQELFGVMESNDFESAYYPTWLTTNTDYRLSRGVYRVPAEEFAALDVFLSGVTPEASVSDKPRKPRSKKMTMKVVDEPDSPTEVTEKSSDDSEESAYDCMVPSKKEYYVPWGHHKDVHKIFKSKMFYPIFISGLSGNGKTFMAMQAAAYAGRECIRVPITMETDEDDLLGGFRLKKGETVWEDGPVIVAMKRGAVLLLDEIDLATNRIMCLQPVLEGNPIFLKKIGKLVSPANGFTVVATANTKGRGDDTAMFVGTNVLNEAFLERFPITLDQPYPDKKTEVNILGRTIATWVKDGVSDEASEFIKHLVNWAASTRETFLSGGADDLIATRRLVFILKAWLIFGNKKKAVEHCISRFGEESKKAFMDLFRAMEKAEEEPAGSEDVTSTDPAATGEAADDDQSPW